MYAIVEIGGLQHKVKKAQKLYVNLLDSEEGTNLEFDKVMLVDNGSDVTVGLPFVDGTRVIAKVMGHVKDDKVHIFKHKRRKGYRRFNGHRQPLTELFVQGIFGKGEKLTEDIAPEKRAPKAKTAETAEVAAPKKKAAAPKKKAAPKKAEGEAKAKKPAAKKAAPKKKSKE